MRTSVIVTHKQVGFHHWPNAPKEVDYLRHPHRHEFTIKVCVQVLHSDREVEFHTLQREIRALFRTEHDFGASSCEHIAKDMVDQLYDAGYRPEWVEVWEDGENGARVEVDP